MQRALDSWLLGKPVEAESPDGGIGGAAGTVNSVRLALRWRWETRAELSSRAGVLVGSKGCFVMLEMTLRWWQSSLLLLTNNEKLEILCLLQRACTVTWGTLHSGNQTIHMNWGCKSGKTQGNPINNTPSGTRHTKTLAHVEGRALSIIVFVCMFAVLFKLLEHYWGQVFW